MPVDESRHTRLGNSPLGEEMLGAAEPFIRADQYPDELLDAVAPQGPEDSRDRLDLHMKEAFRPAANPGTGSTWDNLLSTLAEEFEDLEAVREDITVESLIDTATGKQLNRLGSIVGATRETDETDPHYRARIKFRFHQRTSGPTINDIKQSSAVVLDCDPGEIELTEPFRDEGGEPARINIAVSHTVFTDADLAVGEYEEVLHELKPAGVRVMAQLRGMFTYRSEHDYFLGVNDPEKGYDTLGEDGAPMNIGGAYAGLIYDDATARLPTTSYQYGWGSGTWGRGGWGV